jgi:hypothetical protein
MKKFLCLAFIVGFAYMLMSAAPGSGFRDGFPECDSSYAAAQVKDVYIRMPAASLLGTLPNEVVNAKEVSSTADKRTCSAVMQTTGAPVEIAYEFVKNSQGDMFIQVKLANPQKLIDALIN